jgi:hypothetical protein
MHEKVYLKKKSSNNPMTGRQVCSKFTFFELKHLLIIGEICKDLPSDLFNTEIILLFFLAFCSK